MESTVWMINDNTSKTDVASWDGSPGRVKYRAPVVLIIRVRKVMLENMHQATKHVN